MKKIVNYILAAAVIFGCLTMPAHASSEIAVKLNGVKLYFDQPPILQNDRTLVPMRAIFEAMGCDVYWDGDNQEVDVWQGDNNVMTLWIDDCDMWTPDGLVELDVPPQIRNDRTLVPLRAVSEAMSAKVDWNGNTKTVTISYTAQASSDYTYDYETDDEECEHKHTSEVLEIDLRKCYDIGSSTKHQAVDIIDIVCDDCGEKIDTKKRETNKAHSFKNGICEDCGYEEAVEETPTPISTPAPTPTPTPAPVATQRPATSTKVSDYINGAFMYITVPAGKSIKIPNTSEGSLTIKAEGVGNIMECKADGSYKHYSHNKKNTTISRTISKKSSAIVQNSGDGDLIVSLPSEYASYQETNEKVFEALNIRAGENVQITPVLAKQDCTVYYYYEKYDVVDYKPVDKELYSSAVKTGGYYRSVYSSHTALICPREDMVLYYCPFTTSCEKTSTCPFEELTVDSGETVRISATKESKSVIYTDGVSKYDAVTYGNDGKVKSQMQNKSNGSISIGRDQYVDFTNTSNSPVTIKIPTVYTDVE